MIDWQVKTFLWYILASTTFQSINLRITDNIIYFRRWGLIEKPHSSAITWSIFFWSLLTRLKTRKGDLCHEQKCVVHELCQPWGDIFAFLAINRQLIFEAIIEPSESRVRGYMDGSTYISYLSKPDKDTIFYIFDVTKHIY